MKETANNLQNLLGNKYDVKFNDEKSGLTKIFYICDDGSKILITTCFNNEIESLAKEIFKLGGHKKMSNKDTIRKAIGDLEIGCYDHEMDLLNEANLKKVIDGIAYGGNTDVNVCINRKRYIVEIYREGIEPEIDFCVMTKKEYEELYHC